MDQVLARCGECCELPIAYRRRCAICVVYAANTTPYIGPKWPSSRRICLGPGLPNFNLTIAGSALTIHG